MAYFVILASDESEVCLVIKVVEASLGWLKEEEKPPSDALKANEEKLRTKMPIGSREYEMVPTKAKGVAVGESENSDRSISSLLPIDDKEESPVMCIPLTISMLVFERGSLLLLSELSVVVR